MAVIHPTGQTSNHRVFRVAHTVATPGCILPLIPIQEPPEKDVSGEVLRQVGEEDAAARRLSSHSGLTAAIAACPLFSYLIIIFLQVISLYHLGYDMLAENVIGLLKEPEIVLPSLLAITTQRFKRSLEQSSNQPEWIVTMPPQLYKRLQNTVSIFLLSNILSSYIELY